MTTDAVQSFDDACRGIWTYLVKPGLGVGMRWTACLAKAVAIAKTIPALTAAHVLVTAVEQPTADAQVDRKGYADHT